MSPFCHLEKQTCCNACDESVMLTLKFSHTALYTGVLVIVSCRVCYNVNVHVSIYRSLTVSRNALIRKAVIIAALKM